MVESTQTARILPPAEARAVETLHREATEALEAFRAIAGKYAGKLQRSEGGVWAEVSEPPKEAADG